MTGQENTLPVRGCAEIEPLLAAGIFGSLDGEQRRALADHLERCPPCRAVSAELSEHPVGAALVEEGMIDAADFPELRVVEPENYVRGEEIGRGGMGRVVRARDRRLGRSVVLKELLDNRLRDRFEDEARLTARLQHPAIVNVHEAGRWPSGDSFYAMKHVAGQPLDRAIAARPTLAERLGLLPNLITVIEAVAYAHSQRVIHRDLKPANILVGPFGETVVIDWGLAKDLSRPDGASSPYRGAASAFTVAGAGTPSYMPPEQAEGRASDERVDVFALGATLHHLLAGAPPGTAPLPAAVPPALAAIVRKATARAPEERYPTAGALAEELVRFTGGQLVAAHAYSWRERIERFVRRNRALVAAAALSLLLLAAVAAMSLHQVLEARRRAESQLAELLLERAAQELAGRAPGRATAYLSGALARGLDTPALRALLGDATRAHDALERRVELPVRPAAARLSPDGTQLLTVDVAGVVVRWDVASRSPTTVAAGARRDAPLDFFADGTISAGLEPPAVSGAGGWRLDLSHRSGAVTLTTDAGAVSVVHGAPIVSAGFDAPRRTFMTASADGALRLWDVATGLERAHFETGAPPLDVRLSADGHMLHAVTATGTVLSWRARGRIVAALKGAHQRAAFDPAGNLLVVQDGEVAMLTPDGERVAGGVPPPVPDGARAAALVGELGLEHHPTLLTHQPLLSPDGAVLATLTSDGRVALWDATTGRPRARLLAPGVVEHVRFSADGRRVVLVGPGVTVWDVDGRWLVDLPVVAPSSAAFDARGERLIVGGHGGGLHLFDAATGLALVTHAPLPGAVTEVGFSPSGDRAFALAGELLLLLDTRLSTHTRAQVAKIAAASGVRLEHGRPVARAVLDVAPSPRPAAERERLATAAMKARFERGQDLYERRRYAECAAEFLAAYDAKPAPSLLFNAAVCTEKLGDRARAADLFRRYLAVSASPRDREAVEQRIDALTAAR